MVTIKDLLASVSEAFRSKEVEFIANVLLEYQVPICGEGRGIKHILNFKKIHKNGNAEMLTFFE